MKDLKAKIEQFIEKWGKDNYHGAILNLSDKLRPELKEILQGVAKAQKESDINEITCYNIDDAEWYYEKRLEDNELITEQLEITEEILDDK